MTTYMQGIRGGLVVAACAVGVFGCGNVQGSEPAPDAAAVPDAAARAVQYDIGYIDTFTLNPNITGMFGFVAVVNTGAVPLNLATASVVTFTDDNASVEWSFAKDAGSSILLASGRAAGLLTPVASDKIVSGGVVTDPFDDERLSFAMSFATPLTAGLTLQAQAVLEIDGVEIALPFTITVAAGGLQLDSARRISAPP